MCVTCAMEQHNVTGYCLKMVSTTRYNPIINICNLSRHVTLTLTHFNTTRNDSPQHEFHILLKKLYMQKLNYSHVKGTSFRLVHLVGILATQLSSP